MKTCVNILNAVEEPINVAVFQNALYPAFINQIQKSVESNDLKSIKTLLKHFWLMIKALNESNKVHKNYMNEQNFNVVGPLLGKILGLVRVAKDAATKQINGFKKNFDLDEEDFEKVKEELAKQCESSTYVMEISGQLVLNFGESIASMVKTHFLNYFAINLNAYKNLTESELLDATCFFCDFIEYSFHSDAGMISELNAKFLEIFNSGNEIATTDVKQTLSYGLGVFSKYIPNSSYSAVVPQVLQALNSMISAADAFSEDLVVSTESALGALGKIIYNQRQAAPQLISDQVVAIFLDRLPLTNEEEEAQKTHKFFFEQVIAGNPNIMSDTTRVQAALLRIK